MTQKSMTPPVVELRGTLTGDANNQTRVTGRVEVNWVSYAFQYGVLIIVWSIVISTLLAFQFSVVLRLVLLFVILWIAFGISRIRVHQSKEHLVNALTRALSGD
jgi:uncharacterized protein YqhQ